MVRLLKSGLGALLLAICAGTGLVLLAILLYVGSVVDELPYLPAGLAQLEPPSQTRILDRNGLTIAEIGGSDPVTLSQVSPLFIQALLATEDQSFREHHGIDKRALLRVAYYNLARGRRIGGSTITQQLAKNLFLSFEKKVDRKLREMLLAAEMEARYSKDEILEAYCNTVDFGSGSLGVERAAREYFGKPAASLDLLESATLVAILNAPTRYHPRLNPEACVSRRNWVLERMVRAGHLDPPRRDELAGRALQVEPATRNERGHLRDWVIGQLADAYRELGLDPDAIPYSGLSIITSIDLRLQDLAQRQVRSTCSDLELRLGSRATSLEGAVVMLDPASGEVLALVGGREYGQSAYNCALSPNRQPGSCFKPFLYYTALRNGWSPLDLVVDSVEVFDLGHARWEPHNWDDSEHGPVTLAYGLMQSLNVVMAKVVMELGAAVLAKTAREAGFSGRIDAQPSLALGSSPVLPLELAAAYGAFVNRGIRSEPFVIRRVMDAQGRRVLSRGPRQAQVLDPVESYLVVDALRGAVKYGTGRELLALDYQGELGGKTGTTNDYRDSWFCGVTPNLVSVCWVGNLDNRPMRFNSRSGVTGAAGGLKVFKGMLKELESLRGYGDVFPVPDDVELRKINLTSGVEDPAGVPLALRLIDY